MMITPEHAQAALDRWETQGGGLWSGLGLSPDLARTVIALTAERDALKAAKWAVQHVDTMNDFASLGMDRDEWEAKAKTQAAEIARLREALRQIDLTDDMIWGEDYEVREAYGAALTIARAVLEVKP